MLTKEEIDFLYQCSDTQLMQSIVKKGVTIPSVLITIEHGCYSNCAASAPVEIIIEDKDTIKEGGELFVAEAICLDQESFDDRIKEANRNVTLSHIKATGTPIEVRIFIHDLKDDFPYCVQIDKDEVVGAFKTFNEAAQFVSELGTAGTQ